MHHGGTMDGNAEHDLIRLANLTRAQLIDMEKPRSYKVAYGGVLALLQHVLDVIEQTADADDPIGDIIAMDPS